ncbi:hypothetical protein MBM_07490 [Drepanopeziza brunnea f. sp. 'multigermtubi' MB_m1]|uniref:Uncharacterized protein n=1 Tax=Marssonina brunnea f. sp. multigermtubi (strain MB_m1) TaxID=1072389 RepID=K1WAH0_MARBU|nr:uncharacterized protein MBM_07490 [Drepanopeziza brunnea f. sp. 'multigermtubi' MB_m1]EKD14260.1 hypothetical protein MBM_07490 [Drepanopeziza brunnea f. sp. 'multigermtubi' MB_m1]
MKTWVVLALLFASTSTASLMTAYENGILVTRQDCPPGSEKCLCSRPAGCAKCACTCDDCLLLFMGEESTTTTKHKKTDSPNKSKSYTKYEVREEFGGNSEDQPNEDYNKKDYDNADNHYDDDYGYDDGFNVGSLLIDLIVIALLVLVMMLTRVWAPRLALGHMFKPALHVVKSTHFPVTRPLRSLRSNHELWPVLNIKRDFLLPDVAVAAEQADRTDNRLNRVLSSFDSPFSNRLDSKKITTYLSY